MPQGSAVNPLFNIYVKPLTEIICVHGFTMVAYADNTQIVVSMSPDT